MVYYEQQLWESLGENPRRTPEYVAWVQEALNQLMNAGLDVDGDYGKHTRAAVRAFQQSMGLQVDGDVGDQTEAALAVWAGPPPTAPSVQPFPSGATTPALQALRTNIVNVANQEWQRWNAGGTKIETDPQIRAILKDYWLKANVQVTDAQLASAAWQDQHAWSAAFISWVMWQAGAGSSFNYSHRHSIYIVWAKQNLLTNSSNPFKAFRTTQASLEPGDILCNRRTGGMSVTYDNITADKPTHCNIVTEVRPGQVKLIGGNRSIPGGDPNLGLTVSRTNLATDASGRVTNPLYFAVIKLTP